MESLAARKIRIIALQKERNKIQNRRQWFEFILKDTKKGKVPIIRMHDNYLAPLVPVINDFEVNLPYEALNTQYLHSTMKLIINKLNS